MYFLWDPADGVANQSCADGAVVNDPNFRITNGVSDDFRFFDSNNDTVNICIFRNVEVEANPSVTSLSA